MKGSALKQWHQLHFLPSFLPSPNLETAPRGRSYIQTALPFSVLGHWLSQDVPRGSLRGISHAPPACVQASPCIVQLDQQSWAMVRKETL